MEIFQEHKEIYVEIQYMENFQDMEIILDMEAKHRLKKVATKSFLQNLAGTEKLTSNKAYRISMG